jgi:hypothetical protein
MLLVQGRAHGLGAVRIVSRVHVRVRRQARWLGGRERLGAARHPQRIACGGSALVAAEHAQQSTPTSLPHPLTHSPSTKRFSIVAVVPEIGTLFGVGDGRARVNDNRRTSPQARQAPRHLP